MTLIRTVSPEDAQGAVKAGYTLFMERIGIIPKSMEMLSVSPDLFENQLNRIRYLATHPKLSFALLAHIRYLAALKLNYRFCSDLNKLMLKRLGMQEEDILKMEENPTMSLLEENESAMLVFVVKALEDPESISEEDFKALKTMGWEDGDILDALAQGAGMIEHAVMMRVFQMDQNCVMP